MISSEVSPSSVQVDTPRLDQAGVARELPRVQELSVGLDQVAVDLIPGEIVGLDLLLVRFVALGFRVALVPLPLRHGRGRSGQGEGEGGENGCERGTLHG